MPPRATDTRQKLIETALDLLWKNSYGSVSVDDICRSASVKKGSFYHFFPSKADLAIAAMDETARLTKPLYDDAFSPSLPPQVRFERLSALVYVIQRDAAARHGHVCGCPCASLGSETAGQENRIGAKFEEFNRRNERYYENALRDLVVDGLLPSDTDIRVKAEEISAYLLGQLMLARIRNDLSLLQRDLKSGLFRLIGLNEPETAAA